MLVHHAMQQQSSRPAVVMRRIDVKLLQPAYVIAGDTDHTASELRNPAFLLRDQPANEGTVLVIRMNLRHELHAAKRGTECRRRFVSIGRGRSANLAFHACNSIALALTWRDAGPMNPLIPGALREELRSRWSRVPLNLIRVTPA